MSWSILRSCRFKSPHITQQSYGANKFFARRSITTIFKSHFSSRVLPKADPVIFLDIDGVLFTPRHDGSIQKQLRKLYPEKTNFEPMHYDIAATHLFDTKAVSNLDQLIGKTNAKIVISSDWRRNLTVDQLTEIFAKHSFSKVIVDKTPDMVVEESILMGRAKQINAWLLHHPTVLSFVILDDCDEGLSKQYPKNFVRVNYRNLLTADDVIKAAQILSKKFSLH